MFKKIFGITIMIGLATGLIFGAINRTQAKAAQGERGYANAIAGNGRQGFVGRQGNLEMLPNSGVVARQGNRWTQAGNGNGDNQGNQLNQTGSGYSRGRSGGNPEVGNPQAEVDEWIHVEGEVTAVDSTQISLKLTDGQVVEIYGRPWTYAQENDFSVQVGDHLLVKGFYEGDTFEAGALQNLATGASIQIREENGRPLWAGRGRRG